MQLGIGLFLGAQNGHVPINPANLFQDGREGGYISFHAADNSVYSSAVALPLLTPPTDGQAIAWAVARRHIDPFGVGRSNVIVNGTFDADVNGWTSFRAVVSYSNGRMLVDDSANAGSNSSGCQTFSAVTGTLQRLQWDQSEDAGTGSYVSVSRTELPTTPVLDFTPGTVLGTSSQVRYYVAGAASLQLQMTVNGTGNIKFDNIENGPVNGVYVYQTAGTNRPTWSSDNGGSAIFDGINDVLVMNFPTGFTGELVAIHTDGSFTETHDVNFTAPYNFALSCKAVVFSESLTASERIGVKLYLSSLLS